MTKEQLDKWNKWYADIEWVIEGVSDLDGNSTEEDFRQLRAWIDKLQTDLAGLKDGE